MAHPPQSPRVDLRWWPRFRWYHLSAFLVAINLFSVVASLGLSHLLLNTYELAVHTDLEWTRHFVGFEELLDAVAEVNTPGNEVFLTRDVQLERQKLKLAVAAFLERNAKIRKQIGERLPAAIGEPLLMRLGSVSHAVEQIQERTIRVFELIADGKDGLAGSEMSSANRNLSQALIELRTLRKWTRIHRSAAITKRFADANALRWIERGIALLVFVLILPIVTHGIRLAGEMHEAEVKLGRLSAIVEHSEDAILSEDLFGKITSWNAGAQHLYGYQEQEVLGRSSSFLVPPDRLEDARSIVREVRQGRPVQQVETVRCHKEGFLVDVELTVSPVRNEFGELIGISQISRDIRALLDSERAMQDAKDASEAANRTKSEFLANMSHEIRTPMTAILGFAEVLSNSVKKPEEIDAVETIRRNGEHLIHLINEILDLSKIEAGKLSVERVPVSVPELIAEVIALMKVKADAKGLAIRAEFPEPIPQTIQTDPTRLRQILINLLGNSVKFTEVGLIRLVVRLKWNLRQEPVLQIEVMDTGIGMTSAQVANLFQPFSQADSSMSRKHGGTGLGLSICFRLAQVLGGSITPYSRANVGTTFTLTVSAGSLEGVPLINPAKRASPISRSTTPAMAAELITPLSSAPVLLAEDGPDNQRLIKYMLNKAGIQVTCCDNGKSAHDLAVEGVLQGTPFALILMDMQMPVQDGYEATRRLRERGYKGTIIALTAHAMAGDRDKCINAGCDDYLTKPIERRVLVEMVSHYLARGLNTVDSV